MYQTGGTIKGTLDLVERNEFLLPAIQREFVWEPEQIQRLFDSLMQGYPFGTFLLWRVEAENAGLYRFYYFVRDYHQRDNPHCPPAPLQTQKVTAILDGQQRLTALNIGLRGSMAIKDPWRHWKTPDAFPTRFLCLDLLGIPDPDADGDKYCFAFLTDKQLGAADPNSTCWFKVGDILTMKAGPPMLKWLTDRTLDDEALNAAFAVLHRLHQVIHTEHVIAYYEEKSQELSTVLNIFIRMNSGGTPLTYSDLLLSIAVAQWKNLDARKEIHGLVDELNSIGERFTFSKDLVLKAGLVLTDIGSVGFKVENFNHENMSLLESRWEDVKQSLRLTVRLIDSFGFNGQNLRAHSSILPIAYYLHQLQPGDGYLTTAKYAEDRRDIRTWLMKSLLKSSGIWGSGLDTLLTLLRKTVKEYGEGQFPVKELETVMAGRGKPLTFGDEEIEELLDLPIGNSRTFALLTLLFPFVDLQNNFHIDHIFPRALFTKPRLRKEGLSEDQIDSFQEKRDTLANLQLLDGAANIEKQQTLPAEWLRRMFNDTTNRAVYCDRHLLGDVPESLAEFESFYNSRRERLREVLGALLERPSPLGEPATSEETTSDTEPK